MCCRHNLTPTSDVCEAVPISLLWTPDGLNELPEMSFEFPFNLTFLLLNPVCLLFC